MSAKVERQATDRQDDIDALEAVADSDLPAAQIADLLLDIERDRGELA